MGPLNSEDEVTTKPLNSEDEVTTKPLNSEDEVTTKPLNSEDEVMAKSQETPSGQNDKAAKKPQVEPEIELTPGDSTLVHSETDVRPTDVCNETSNPEKEIIEAPTNVLSVEAEEAPETQAVQKEIPVDEESSATLREDKNRKESLLDNMDSIPKPFGDLGPIKPDTEDVPHIDPLLDDDDRTEKDEGEEAKENARDEPHQADLDSAITNEQENSHIAKDNIEEPVRKEEEVTGPLSVDDVQNSEEKDRPLLHEQPMQDSSGTNLLPDESKNTNVLVPEALTDGENLQADPMPVAVQVEEAGSDPESSKAVEASTIVVNGTGMLVKSTGQTLVEEKDLGDNECVRLEYPIQEVEITSAADSETGTA